MKKEFLIDLFFPCRCPVCGEIVQPAGGLICPPCFQKLSFVTAPTCKKCGKEITSKLSEYCEDCAGRRRSFEYALALLNYDETAKRSMAQIKYKNKREYLDFYGEAITVRFGKSIARMRPDALVPVPVHASRRRTRGFNQAEILAERIGERLGISVCADALVRTKKTLPQKELTPMERQKNLAGAFAAGKVPENLKTAVLIDDIYTTGSTVEACARALKAAGVERVYVIVVCMTGGR